MYKSSRLVPCRTCKIFRASRVYRISRSERRRQSTSSLSKPLQSRLFLRAHKSFVSSLPDHFRVNFIISILIAAQQLQESGECKWQVLTTAPSTTQTFRAASPAQTQATTQANNNDPQTDPNGSPPKTRVRRVACTCPNCTDGERYRFVFNSLQLNVD